MTDARKQLQRAQRGTLEHVMQQHLACLRIPGLRWERQYAFCPERRYRADFAELTHKLLVEVQGATWANGRHTRGAGYENDCERAALAQIYGWDLIQVTRGMIEDGRALFLVERWFLARGDVTKLAGVA